MDVTVIPNTPSGKEGQECSRGRAQEAPSKGDFVTGASSQNVPSLNLIGENRKPHIKEEANAIEEQEGAVGPQRSTKKILRCKWGFLVTVVF